MKSTHILIFKGIGQWRDQEGVIYEQSERIEVKSDKTEKEYLLSRPDIKFMVEYGQLVINTATVEETVTPKETVVPNVVVTPVAPKVTPVAPKVTPVVK